MKRNKENVRLKLHDLLESPNAPTQTKILIRHPDTGAAYKDGFAKGRKAAEALPFEHIMHQHPDRNDAIEYLLSNHFLQVQLRLYGFAKLAPEQKDSFQNGFFDGWHTFIMSKIESLG